jgi:transcriptional regulator with XRE-family HTH domain
MQPSELLDLIKQALNLTSDYQVMKKLEFNQVTISNWRTNRSYPKNSVLIQFAEILRMNAGILFMYGLEWREKDVKTKEQIGKLINVIHHTKFDDEFTDSHV